jgi:hypothetical protein
MLISANFNLNPRSAVITDMQHRITLATKPSLSENSTSTKGSTARNVRWMRTSKTWRHVSYQVMMKIVLGALMRMSNSREGVAMIMVYISRQYLYTV